MHVYFGKEKELLSEWFGIFDWERSIGRTDETGDRYRRQIEQSNTKKWLPSLNTWSWSCASQTAQSKSEWKWGSTWFVKSKMSRPELTFTTCGTGGSGARRTFRFWISSRRGALFFSPLFRLGCKHLFFSQLSKELFQLRRQPGWLSSQFHALVTSMLARASPIAGSSLLTNYILHSYAYLLLDEKTKQGMH